MLNYKYGFWESWLERFNQQVSVHGSLKVYMDFGLLESLKGKDADKD
jgi:hypothetical protein